MASLRGTHTKGAAIRSFLRWYQRDRAEQMRRVALSVPVEHRRLINPTADALGVLASEWYPSELVHALIDGMTAGLDELELKRMADEGGRGILQDALGGIYKMLFAFIVNPERYAKHANRVWRVFHDSGTSEITSLSRREHRLKISDWRGHHPFICRLHRATSALLYGEMKCKNVVLSDDECVARGGAACVCRIFWE